MRINSEARNALRSAIRENAAWNSAFRNKHGFSFASMSRDDYLRACQLLGIDAAVIVAGANFEKNAVAKEAFSDDAPKVVRNEEKRAHAVTKDVAGREDRIAAMLANMLRELADVSSKAVDADAVRNIVKAELKALGGSVTRIEVTDSGLPVGASDGTAHPLFERILRVAISRDVNGFAPAQWLAGPAGSGKTYACEQVAKCLDLPFHFNGSIGMAHELLGFVDAGGTYHPTAFRKAYENGGVYLFDEIDGSDNAAVLALNAALAGKTATFPDGPVKRHKDCVIFAAANTWGNGANAEYVGRAKLDAAILSRFPVKHAWNYDEKLERDMCGNPDFAKVVQNARKAALNIGLKVLITPRDSIAGAALIAAGFNTKEACEMTFLANLSDEQKDMVRRNMGTN